MSSEPDRNPSPPLGILNEELLPDRIADTAYSKRWTIKTLMNIVQASCNSSEGINKSMESNSTAEEKEIDIVELDSNIEEDACTLWDMSASKPVAKYLIDFEVWEIFLDVIHRTKSPRLLEIVIGILGNICTFDELCQNLSEKKGFINTALILSGTTDTPSLIQLFRLIRCGIKNSNCRDLWLDAFEKSPFFIENIKDILSNTLNCNLIHATFQFLYALSIENTNYCEIWSQDSYLASLTVSSQQLFMKKECLDNFFNLLNSLCTCSSVTKAVVENWNALKSIFKGYIDNLVKEESLFDSTRLSSVYSYFDVYITILNYPSIRGDMVSDMTMLTPFAKILASVNQLIENIKKNNWSTLNTQNPESDDGNSLQRIEQRNGSQYITIMSREEFDLWGLLSNIIIEAAKVHQKLANEEGGGNILEAMVNSTIHNETEAIVL